MSYGSISCNAHAALAMAACEPGTYYNTGEGGPTRIRDNVGIPVELALAAVDSRLRSESFMDQAGVELRGRPFYVGVQFHPEFKIRPNRPHPIFLGFVNAALDRQG